MFASLPQADKKVVGNLWTHKEHALRDSIKSNAELATAIAEYSRDFFVNQGYAEEMQRMDEMIELESGKCEPSNEEKAVARSAIRQIWRDWSFEATGERNACFAPIVEDIVQHFYRQERSQIKILIPGSGLNRLGFNLSCAGYDVEANEVSYIHLLATNFILSRTNNGHGTVQHPGFLGDSHSAGAQSTFEICPWNLSFSNNLKTANQFTRYAVPEIMPASSRYLGQPPTLDTTASTLAFSAPRFSLNGNNFMTDYTDASSAGQYDLVITCFFIDTAPNFLSYIRTIKHILKPHGVWINVGPLLWNCFENGPGGRREGDITIDEDTQARQQPPLPQAQPQSQNPMQEDPSTQWDKKLEFSHEEVMLLLQAMDFRVRKDRDVGTSGYCFDERGLMNTEYKLRFWVASKGDEGESAVDIPIMAGPSRCR
ncbi:N2227-domain-containing protein [Venturia nashicola]|uniref:carnosine N-methyltransferase n=1 Tax=Venturia nashicola TaxID=86259 RepID=A0A4Z1P5L6_9PEZI|nr:N2227-domain-containing protein [Venturia nashicola]